MLGHKLYEQFDVVVGLTTQVRVMDSVWVDLLRWARHGKCFKEDLLTLQELVLIDPKCNGRIFHLFILSHHERLSYLTMVLVLSFPFIYGCGLVSS